jgi:hypothetical protein
MIAVRGPQSAVRATLDNVSELTGRGLRIADCE